VWWIVGSKDHIARAHRLRDLSAEENETVACRRIWIAPHQTNHYPRLERVPPEARTDESEGDAGSAGGTS
jgi:hypothetical protein